VCLGQARWADAAARRLLRMAPLIPQSQFHTAMSGARRGKAHDCVPRPGQAGQHRRLPRLGPRIASEPGRQGH